MLCKRYYIIFSTFSLKFKCKICIQKEVIHNCKKSYFGHVTSHEPIHFKKMERVWKTRSLLFCLRYDPLIVFRRKNHNFDFHKNDVTWPLSANGLFPVVTPRLGYWAACFRTMVMHLDPMIFCSPDVTFVAKNELMIRWR